MFPNGLFKATVIFNSPVLQNSVPKIVCVRVRVLKDSADDIIKSVQTDSSSNQPAPTYHYVVSLTLACRSQPDGRSRYTRVRPQSQYLFWQLFHFQGKKIKLFNKAKTSDSYSAFCFPSASTFIFLSSCLLFFFPFSLSLAVPLPQCADRGSYRRSR